MDFASALERSAMYRSKVATMEQAFAASPEDKGLRITLLSTKRMADRAEAELLEMASTAQVDLCRYRVVRNDENEYPVAPFAKSIASYQDLFTALYNFIKHGAKSSARYALDVEINSSLNVGYTFPGSLGVLFTIPSGRDMFGTGDLDRVIEGLRATTSIESKADVQALAKEMGLNVVRKTYAWAEQNRVAGYSVDIQWRSSSENMSGEFLTRSKFGSISSLISETEDQEPKLIEIVGTLGAYSMLRDTFAIVTRDNKTYSGKVHADFPRNEYSIPREYRARIMSTTVVKYAEHSAAINYELLSLEEL